MFSKQSTIRKIARKLRRRGREKFIIYFAGLRARLKRKSLSGKIIAVTGSSGKSSTVALLGHILSGWRKTQTQVIENTFVPISNAIAGGERNADFRIFEVGASEKGRILKASRLIQPDVAIITMFNIEHRSSFRSINEVVQEKADLVRSLRPDGLAVLNADDPHMAVVVASSPARVVTFGTSQNVDYTVSDLEFSFPGPLGMTISSRHGTTRLTVPFVGVHFWVSVAAAFATAMELGVPLDIIVSRCADFTPVEGRSQLVNLANGVSFLLDTAKAPWHSIETALKPLEQVKGRRRIVIIGQISDYGGASTPKYKKASRLAQAVSEMTIFVGNTAHKPKPSIEQTQTGRLLSFADVIELNEYLKANLKSGDLVFIKSSGNLHLERLALAWQNDVKCWVEKCGLSIGCVACGLSQFPYPEHGAIRKKSKFFNRLKSRLKSLGTENLRQSK